MILTKDVLYPAAASLAALAGAATDLKSRRIPNLLTGPALLLGLMLHFSFDGWWGLGSSFLAGLICGAIFLIFFLAGGMGAGDVKLIAAAGCLAGLSNVSSLLILTALAGGVMGIALAVMRGQMKQTFVNVASLASHHRQEGFTPHPELNVLNSNTLRLPYGLAIAAGCCVTLVLQGVKR